MDKMITNKMIIDLNVFYKMNDVYKRKSIEEWDGYSY